MCNYIKNEEVIFKEHDLKLAIQKEIMDKHQEIINTNDIGYLSWQIATQIVDSKKKSKKVNKFFKLLLDKTEIRL
jgi:hypothetical protein